MPADTPPTEAADTSPAPAAPEGASRPGFTVSTLMSYAHLSSSISGFHSPAHATVSANGKKPTKRGRGTEKVAPASFMVSWDQPAEFCRSVRIS